MADNLRALAKQSWDAIFAQAYPKLGQMIRSINEEMERTLEDSKRELKTTTLAMEGFEQKLVTTKSNISTLVNSQEKINSYLSMIDLTPSAQSGGGGGLDLTMPNLTKLKDKSKNTKVEEKNKGKSEEQVKKSTTEKLKTGSWLSATGKLINIGFLASLAYDTYMYIYNLDPKDPDYAEKASVKISQAVALVGFIEFAAAISACVGSAIAPGVGTIIGALGGLAAGWFFKDDVNELTETIVKKIFEYKKKLAGGESPAGASLTPTADISGGALSSMSSTDSIRFVADKIIFRSAQGAQEGQEPAPNSTTGGSAPQATRAAPDVDTTRPAGSGFGQSSGQAGGRQQSMGGGGMFPQSYGSEQPRTSGGGSNLRYDATQAGSRSNVTPTISQGEYYNKMYAAVYEAAKQRGLPNPEVIASIGAAQTSLETGYGKHMVGNNAFGIKGTGSAGTVNANTQEFVNGRMVGMKQGFRAYGDVTESAGDYVDMMLKNQKRYGGVLNATSVEEAIAAQAKSGYATDPAYGSKLSSINSKFAGAPSKDVAAKPEPKAPTSGPAVNKASIESKVDKEKQQQTASMEVNNLVSQSPSSQTPEQTPNNMSGKEVAVNDRLGRLIAQT